MKKMTSAVILSILSLGLIPSSASALPDPQPQPGNAQIPKGPSKPNAANPDCIAKRNFIYNTPGAAITGGLFSGSYNKVPAFYGDKPGDATGGWVSSHPCT